MSRLRARACEHTLRGDCSSLRTARVWWVRLTARVRRAHHPPLPGTINLVCATREHEARPSQPRAGYSPLCDSPRQVY